MSDNPYAAPQTGLTSAAPDARSGISGLRGWLILLCATLIISLLVKLATIVRNLGVIGGPDWAALTTPGSPNHDAMWGPAIIAEIVMVAVVCLVNAYVLVLYFGKRARFVLWFDLFVAMSVLVTVIDLVLCSLIANFPEAARNGLFRAIGQILAYAAVWCTYVHRSVRVRNTFVK